MSLRTSWDCSRTSAAINDLIIGIMLPGTSCPCDSSLFASRRSLRVSERPLFPGTSCPCDSSLSASRRSLNVTDRSLLPPSLLDRPLYLMCPCCGDAWDPGSFVLVLDQTYELDTALDRSGAGGPRSSLVIVSLSRFVGSVLGGHTRSRGDGHPG